MNIILNMLLFNNLTNLPFDCIELSRVHIKGSQFLLAENIANSNQALLLAEAIAKFPRLVI